MDCVPQLREPSHRLVQSLRRVGALALFVLGTGSPGTAGAAAPTVVSGGDHTCALTSGGAVKCWGSNAMGQLGDGTVGTDRLTPIDVVGLADRVVAIAAGGRHTCALTSGGAAKCWGRNSMGQLGDGTSGTDRLTPVDVAGLSSGVVAIAAGELHTCVLTSGGAVKCTGSNYYGQLGDGTVGTNRLTPVDVVGLANGVVAIATGGGHTCALTSGGAVKCWGRNSMGQLGDGTVGTNRLTPVGVVGLPSGVIAIAGGANHTCALTRGGAVKCWGDNFFGQVGDAGATIRLTPVDVVGLAGGVVAISTGADHTCALTRSGAVKCWGRNGTGQLGDGTRRTNRLTPVDVAGLASGVVAIAAGELHTCALTSSGVVQCWGYNSFGQLGDDTSWTGRPTPVDVVGLAGGVVAISAGTDHTCALTRGGAVKCTGDNFHGQLGDGTSGMSRLTPGDVAGLASGVAAISAGFGHTCALTSGGAVKCWGNNGAGQLGDGTSGPDRLTPVDVVGLANGVVAIAARGYHTCALTGGGAVKCWGENNVGQLGDGTVGTNRLTPVDVAGLAGGVVAIAAGGVHTCALTSGGAVKCWGYNYAGQLGDGTVGTTRLTPVDVAGLASGVVAIAAGGSHTCALTRGGAVKCWGENASAQLGDGTVGASRLTPIDVVGLASGVVAIAAGGSHTCALTRGGAAKCWGRNDDGRLGDGTVRTIRLAPVDVVGLASGVAAISAGYAHTCALTSGGAAKCWGDYEYGQLGIEFIRTVVGLDLDADAALAEIPTLSVWALVLVSALVAASAYLARRTALPRISRRP